MDNEKVYEGTGKATDYGGSSKNSGGVRRRLSSLLTGVLRMKFLDKMWEAKCYNKNYHAQYFTEGGNQMTYFGEILVNVGEILDNNVVESWKVIPYGWGRFGFASEVYDGFFFGDRILMCRYKRNITVKHVTFCRGNPYYVQLGERVNKPRDKDKITYYDLGSSCDKQGIQYPLNKEGSEVVRYSHKLFENNQFKYYIVIYQPISDSNKSTVDTVDVLTLRPDEYATIDGNDNITVYSINNKQPLATIPPRPIKYFFEHDDEDYLLQQSVDRMKVKYFIPFPFLCSCDETPCKGAGPNCENANDDERFGEKDSPAQWYHPSSTSSH